MNLRKHGYVLIWAGLVLAVCLVWLLGRGEAEPGTVTPAPTPLPPLILPSPAAQEETELKGVWVPYFSLETEGHSEEGFKENFNNIVKDCAEKGFNALFVHVRPFCDAVYPSELFPWSHIISGEQGGDPGFDPLEYMIEACHGAGVEFHAWINPLRVKTAQVPTALSGDNPYYTLRADAPYYFMEYAGGVYLNPAFPYVRKLIADGAGEIAAKYKVDGIHFDDYFYPAQEEELDREAYDLYREGVTAPLGLLEWRRGNISAMVEEVYRRIKEADPQVEFGISPQGNIENDENMGADVKAWCTAGGYIDYICPQLYYSFENPSLAFSSALTRWVELYRRPGLKMYIGLGLYKAGSDADSGTWLWEEDIIARQVQAAREAGCHGVVIYSWDYLNAEQTRKETENALAALGQ